MGREWMIPQVDERTYFEVKATVMTHDKEVESAFYEFVCFVDELDEKVDAAAEEEFRTNFHHVIEWMIVDKKGLINIV